MWFIHNILTFIYIHIQSTYIIKLSLKYLEILLNYKLWKLIIYGNVTNINVGCKIKQNMCI